MTEPMRLALLSEASGGDIFEQKKSGVKRCG